MTASTPEQATNRGDRKVRLGVVVSDKMDKTVVVEVEDVRQHRLYHKTILRDPDEPTRTYAYEAVSALPHNTTFIFAPDGSVLVPDGNGGTLHAPAETAG